MTQPSPFTPARFDFFRELKRHNEKAWFVERFAERCRVGAPFVRWLCGAAGVPF